MVIEDKLFPKGSEWRKWDLHIHTPKSIIQHYGGDTPEVWEKYISDLEQLPEEYKAIGINDYFFLDGYKEVLKFKNNGRLANIDLILPVIELRLDKFASLGADDPWKKVNFHIIFSNKIDAEIIESHFIKAVQTKLKIDVNGDDEDFNEIITYETLNQLGRKIKENTSKTINDSDLKTGFNSLTFNFEVILEKLQATTFKGKYLTAVGKSEWETMRWDGSPGAKKTVINKANFVFTALEKHDIYLKHKEKLIEQKINDKLLDCSDAHHFSTSTDKDRIGNSFTWLKADTTFEGLKQVSNDKSRIFVGEKPELLTRVESGKTKFISSVSIDKIAGSTLTENWFNGLQIPFNHSMVAIIGNKGNGKSAIADTIGLVGNTKNYEYFSFLRSEKFRSRKPINRSEHFEATLSWEDGSSDVKKLNENPDKSSTEKVKYIPQGFLEKLCNDDVDDFENELRNVIFSHISDVDRLGKTNLDELIEYKTEIKTKEIDELKKEINFINKSIADLEKKQGEEFKKAIELKLKEKESELNAHEATKPISIEPPDDPQIVTNNKVISDEIDSKRAITKEIEDSISEKQKALKELKLDVSELEKVAQTLTAFETQFDKFKIEITPSLTKFEIKTDDVISFRADKSKVLSLIESKGVVVKGLEKDLDKNEENGLIGKGIKLVSEIKVLQEKLDDHSKKYQKYIDDQKLWEEKKNNIIGQEDKDETINYYKAQIQYLNEKLNEDISAKIIERKTNLKLLFSKKNEILNLYKSLFKPVSDFIATYREVLENYNIALDVDYKINGFNEKFFDHISLGSKGSFIGNPAGIERLNHIIGNHELKSEDGLISFLDEIIDNLKFDKRESTTPEKREVEKQLKKGYSIYDLYSFLFNLDYLEPAYKLKLNEKNISELSPGERGALLLIFYLTIDQNDIPLVIDQPEENLDNQSVFKILVKFIKDAKEKRQIIIVTHNPNLAVACNAEQIIHVSIDKKDKNTVRFISGSLCNKQINDDVIDILEGTYPALNTRTSTYKVIERKPH